MATSSKRDVALGVKVEVDGTASITELGTATRGVGEAAAATTPQLDALTAATKERRTAEAAARTEAAAAKKALQEQQDALALLKAESDRATKSTVEYGAQERALAVAVVAARTALRDKQAAVTAAATASASAAAAETTLAAQIDRTAAATRRQAEANRENVSTTQELQSQLAILRNIAGVALGGSVIGSLAKELAETADGYANLSARIKIATGEGGNFKATFDEVFKVAQRTGVSVEEVGSLVVKLTQAGREMNLTSTDALRLAESVSQATQLSGASAQEAAASVTQFAQAIASGRLQGDELKSLLENSPRLARALADGLGVAVGQLKELGAAGALTAQQVVTALQGQSAALEREFAQLPLTVGRAVTNLGSAWVEYIGRTDQATSASHTAAAAIDALARNLSTVAEVLFGVGKAAAAYGALRLAETFLASAAAAGATARATAAATVATTAHTAAVAANTAAQVGQAAAAAETVATTGRLASVLGTIKLLSFIGVVTNIKSIGTAIGETIAKWTGAGEAMERLEAATKADEAASRANAQAKAAQAQATQQASDKALGLNKEARALIATFDGLREKGETVVDSLAKITKELQLGDLKGIANAGAALDALAIKGKASGQQIRDALAAALKGDDLAVFATQAAAAFDRSEQGARRLAAALDAVATESLRRAGTSVRELETGFSDASRSAINDVDALAATLDKLGVKSTDTQRALSKSLDQALSAASTERAVQAVIDRFDSLGKSGALAGDLLTDGLEKARKKLDDLVPGVQTLDDALRALGLSTQAQSKETADKFEAAYRKIASSAGVSVQTQIDAFARYRTASLAASNGVETGQLAVQRVILQNRADVAGLGDTMASAMGKGAAATDTATRAQRGYTEAVNASAGALSRMEAAAVSALDARYNLNKTIGAGSDKAVSTLGGTGTLGKNADGSVAAANGQAVPPNAPGTWVYTLDSGKYTERGHDANGRTLPGGWYRTDAGGGNGPFGGAYTVPNAAPATAAAPTVAAAPLPQVAVPINVTIGGRTRQVTAASLGDANLMIQALENAYLAGGGI